MDADDDFIKSFLEGTKQYVIPAFQRSYCWDTKQWEDLWNDICEIYTKKDYKEHFIGSIVTRPDKARPAGISKYLLIDGQQRLATLLIIIAILRNKAKSFDVKLSEEIEFNCLRNTFKKGKDQYKLLPIKADQKDFFKIISGKNSLSYSNLAQAFYYFDKKIDDSGYDVGKLFNTLTLNLVAVSITLDTKDNPYLIFESLNAKGAPLTQADLVRNYYCMRLLIINAEREAYQKIWTPMQNNLGKNLTDFIWNYLKKDGKFVRKDDIYYELKGRLNYKDEATVLESLKDLANYSTYYEKLIDPSKEKSLKIKRRLKRLNRWGVTTSYPFLLNLYHDLNSDNLSKDEFSDILEITESYIVRRAFCRIPTNALNQIFIALYKLIDKTDYLDSLRENLKKQRWPEHSDFREGFEDFEIYTSGIEKCKLVLESLEEFYKHKEKVDFSNLTIEHIMPRAGGYAENLPDEWKKMLGENYEDIYLDYVDTLGNLTLTGYNPELSDSPFPKKKKLLSKSHVELNKYFTDSNKWTKDEIVKRSEYLADIALKVWSR